MNLTRPSFDYSELSYSASRRFATACRKILESPYDDSFAEVRPHWEDGTPAHTKKIFGYTETYCLAPGFIKEWGFPMMTLRPINWKAALDEILWIYQKRSNNIHDLKSHIWDSWADETGSIGKAYGYQIAKETNYKDTGPMNQMDRVIYDLRTNPTSRAIMTMMYNMEDLPEMGLRPCCHGVNWNVTYDSRFQTKYLNAVVMQRSQDMIVANNWNLVQYSLLLLMVAHVTNLVPGYLMHVITDAHIYDRHIPIARELIRRWDVGGVPFQPTQVWIDPEVKEFDQFTVDSIKIEPYAPMDFDMKIPVAV